MEHAKSSHTILRKLALFGLLSLTVAAKSQSGLSPPPQADSDSWFKGNGNLPSRKDVLFKTISNIPETERSILYQSDNMDGHKGQTGASIYQTMDSKERATLFNIFAKMKADSLPADDAHPEGSNVLQHIMRISRDDSDRIFVEADEQLLGLVEKSPHFHRRNRFACILHSPAKADSTTATWIESFKDDKPEGGLELDFTITAPKKRLGVLGTMVQQATDLPKMVRVEADIDKHAEQWRHMQIIRHLIGEVAYNHIFHQKTNAYNVLKIEQKQGAASQLYKLVPRTPSTVAPPVQTASLYVP